MKMVRNKSLSAFALDSAGANAEQFLDRQRFALSAAQWEKFQAALERPAQVKPNLVKLFASRTPWEE